MTESPDPLLATLQEMRDIMQQQSQNVSKALNDFVELHKEHYQKYDERQKESHKAYVESQATYKKKLEKQIEAVLEKKPWLAIVFVISLGIIAICLLIDVVLKLIKY